MPKSTWLPILLVAYLAFMAYIGRGLLSQGQTAFYLALIAVTLAVIATLHFFLKKQERKRRGQ